MYLLPDVKKQFRANTHTHSILSDGKLSPEELKEKYKNEGYDILAITDHELCIDHSDLNDEDFLTLTAYEVATNDVNDKLKKHTYHFNLISKTPNNTKQVFFHPDDLGGRRDKYLDMIVCDEYKKREYSVECMNELIREANEAGYLVVYNHPTWSLQNWTDYSGLHGLWGVEIINGVCIKMGHEDYQPHVFDDLLKLGNRIFPIAADDIHRPEQAFIGYLMIAAETLTYESVISALEAGDFYATSGPRINELTFDGGILKIKTSDAVQIRVCTENRRRYVTDITKNDGKLINEAAFDISEWIESSKGASDCFFRVAVVGADGHMAYTRAYFADQLPTACN